MPHWCHRPIGRALLCALLIGALIPTSAAMADPDPWTKAGTQALIVGPFHLIVGFTDPNGVPKAALVTALPPATLTGMPSGLQKASQSPFLQAFPGNANYFESLWSAIRGQVCSDLQGDINRLVNHSPNTAYDIQRCLMNPKGYVAATFQTQWENDQFQYVNGRRLLLRFSVPLNGITFWVTSPHTCNHDASSCGVEPRDPAYMLIFTANIAAVCAPTPYATVQTFALPISCTPEASVDIDALIGGDATGQLQAATKAWGKQVASEAASIILSGGASAPVALASFAANTVKEIGIAVADLTNAHLRDSVSAWLSIVNTSGALKVNAANVGANLNSFFQNLYYAQLGGFRPFLVGVSQAHGLDFGLVYPPSAKPQVKNLTAAANAGSIISPGIALSQPEVEASQTVPVTASNFRGTYVNSLDIGWNQTVIGKTLSTVNWGPPPVTISTPALTFHALGLKPATTYGFRVHECDGLTCAPESDALTTATEAAASNQVTFWLDADKAHPVGSAAVTSANFITSITVPPATAPGSHVLYAAVPGQPTASTPLVVCRPGSCLPSLSVVNMSNNTLYPPGAEVVVALPVTLRGSRFAPGGAVAFFLDTPKGPKVGGAAVGPLGNCQGKFTMPLVSPGAHKFVALETSPKLLQATVPVYVQAAPQ
jgi:hypothetical protein